MTRKVRERYPAAHESLLKMDGCVFSVDMGATRGCCLHSLRLFYLTIKGVTSLNLVLVRI